MPAAFSATLLTIVLFLAAALLLVFIVWAAR